MHGASNMKKKVSVLLVFLAVFLVVLLFPKPKAVQHPKVFAEMALEAHSEYPTAFPFLPDKKLTTGLVDPDATKEVVCSRSTSDVRHVTPRMMREVYAAYNFAKKPGCCEVDHLISLELGGLNNLPGKPSTLNLWPQQYEIYFVYHGEKIRAGAHEKDLVENDLHHHVCVDEDMELAQAQKIISEDWLGYYLKAIYPKQLQGRHGKK
jgi:hypothetical protein